MKRILSLIFYIASCACLVLAIFLLVLTASLLSTQIALNFHVAPLALSISQLLPAELSFWGVVSSPFGGVFRTDFALVACVFYLLGRLLRMVGKRIG